MKRILLLFFGLLAVLTGTRAADGTLSVSNVKNAVPGYTGSLDIVLSGSDQTYVGFQFDLTLPDGLTYSSYANGALINGHVVQGYDEGSNKTRFTGYANPTAPLTAANGTLLTIYFNVDGSTSAGDLAATIDNMAFSYNSASYHPTQGTTTITIGNTVTLSEDDTTAPSTVSGVYVTVNRTLKADMWNTICLPFAMTNAQLKTAFGDDVLLGDFGGYTESDGNIAVSFTSATAIEANHPYIIKVSSVISSFSITDATVDISPVNKPMNNKGENATAAKIKAMIGTYKAETIIPENSLFLNNNQFKYSLGNSTLKGYRAYFTFCDFAPDTESRTFTIDYFDMTTGMHSISRGMADGNAYNLQGQQVDESAKGVQIKNGKKLINK